MPSRRGVSPAFISPAYDPSVLQSPPTPWRASCRPLLLSVLGACFIAILSTRPRPGDAVMLLLAPGTDAGRAALRIAEAPGWRLLRDGTVLAWPFLIAVPEAGADHDRLRRAVGGLLLVSTAAVGPCLRPSKDAE
jgi:hypothetical protein